MQVAVSKIVYVLVCKDRTENGQNRYPGEPVRNFGYRQRAKVVFKGGDGGKSQHRCTIFGLF